MTALEKTTTTDLEFRKQHAEHVTKFHCSKCCLKIQLNFSVSLQKLIHLALDYLDWARPKNKFMLRSSGERLNVK